MWIMVLRPELTKFTEMNEKQTQIQNGNMYIP